MRALQLLLEASHTFIGGKSSAASRTTALQPAAHNHAIRLRRDLNLTPGGTGA
jgi:hypothetical protein